MPEGPAFFGVLRGGKSPARCRRYENPAFVSPMHFISLAGFVVKSAG
jgi:hypothetical protein